MWFELCRAFTKAAMAALLLFMFLKLIFACWVSPIFAYKKLKRNGFKGPTPTFPLGNITEMKKNTKDSSSSFRSSTVSHDIHSTALPYFSRWQKSYGKVFVYWLGTEPFLCIADPEFLKKISEGVMGKSWGKPDVFKQDREPMFGNGLNMVEGDEWVRHRHVITPAFTPANLKNMSNMMVESTTKMLDKWTAMINSGNPLIDVEKEMIETAGEIIARTSFGTNHEVGTKVLEKLRAMQMLLFKSNRYVGVPLNKYLISPRQTRETKRLGKEIDELLLTIINDRKNDRRSPQKDLLGLLSEAENNVDGRDGKTLTPRELVDECKTFFFGGQETTALAVTWTLLVLAMHPEWQEQLREEIRQVVGEKEVDATMLARLKKMGWVMNEVLRLYSPAPNAQRQVREEIRVSHDDNRTVIPSGTNIWIDVVSMHHDPELWGEDVYEFKPERFKEDILYGGCKHKMGFLPFGFGGRMCIGKNLSAMEYKIVLTLILSRFSFSLSPTYTHAPSLLLSLRPSYGLPLVLQTL
ncbi:cytokinin hydroxylase [Carica papaya]|uniref:cytokinin hydroxylase n=1 Tax=Carica papaya TaxID=3649 RepID=UPI000B8CC4DC|nr:cytokinin hydroxylase [Carica papaya]